MKVIIVKKFWTRFVFFVFASEPFVTHSSLPLNKSTNARRIILMIFVTQLQ